LLLVIYVCKTFKPRGLGDTLVIYKNRVNGSGNGNFLMCHWK